MWDLFCLLALKKHCSACDFFSKSQKHNSNSTNYKCCSFGCRCFDFLSLTGNIKWKQHRAPNKPPYTCCILRNMSNRYFIKQCRTSLLFSHFSKCLYAWYTVFVQLNAWKYLIFVPFVLSLSQRPSLEIFFLSFYRYSCWSYTYLLITALPEMANMLTNVLWNMTVHSYALRFGFFK